MKMRNVFILVIVIVSLPILEQPNFAQEPVRFVTDPPQRLDVPFRLFRTENIWTQLLLDTRNGRIWQVCYSVDPNAVDRKFPINDTPLVALVDNEKEVGRFTLYPTGNMWTFLLLDQKTGYVWHCQFSMEGEDYRFIRPIFSGEEWNKILELSTTLVRDTNTPKPPEGFVSDSNQPNKP